VVRLTAEGGVVVNSEGVVEQPLPMLVLGRADLLEEACALAKDRSVGELLHGVHAQRLIAPGSPSVHGTWWDALTGVHRPTVQLHAD
jgi:hypothetical protein